MRRNPVRVDEREQVLARRRVLVELGRIECRVHVRCGTGGARENQPEAQCQWFVKKFHVVPSVVYDYQISTMSPGARRSASPALQSNARANAAMSASGPLTRNFAGACSLDCTCRRNCAG